MAEIRSPKLRIKRRSFDASMIFPFLRPTALLLNSDFRSLGLNPAEKLHL
jgi:hypothetical protein